MTATLRSALDDRLPSRRGWATLVVAAIGWVVVRNVWPAPVGVLLQGVIVGSLTAMIAFGIGLTYGSNRIINFAQADLGSVPVALAVSLMTFKGLSFWLAFPLVVVLSAALGFLVERLILRRFSKAPRLILMVVTIGVAQVLAGAASAIPFAVGGRVPSNTYEPPFDVSIEVSPVIFHANEVIAVVVVLLAGAMLALLLRRTSIGIAIRASAESAERASLLGINVGRTQSFVWVVAAVLAGIATMLRAGVLGVPFGSAFGPELMLRALAAAAIGRMEKFSSMFVAAVALGMIEVSILYNDGNTALVGPVVFVVVVTALLLQRSTPESRVADQAVSSWADVTRVRPVPPELARLPEIRWGRRVLGLVLAGGLLVLPVFLDVGHTNLAAALLIYAVLAVSLVILVGWAGEISLGHVGFLGIGAAVSAGLNVHLRWDLTVSILAAGLVGAVAALLVGLPALKIRGIFLGVTTLAFAVLTSTYLLNRDYFGYLPDNLREPVVRFPLFGRVDISGERSFYYVCLGVLGIALWAAGGLSGRFQRVLVATRDNERTAQSFGLHSARLKLAGFAVSGFFASLAGGLLAIHQRGLGTQLYQPAESLRALTMVVVGGIGSIPGALLGTVFVKATEWFDFLVPPNYGFFFTFAGSGVGLVLVLMVVPGGLGSLLYAGRDRLLRAVARRRGIDLPEWTGTPVDAVAAPGRTVDGRSPAPAADGLLGVRALDFSYGHVQVLFGVDLDVRPGEIVALLGTNGAGKTTILRALSGISTASAGSITFEGQDITRLPPHRVAAAGIAQVPGGKAIFPSLTVAEHLRLAGWLQRGDAAATAAALDEVHGIFPVLRDKSGLQAASLSGGQQQMLGLAMAFVARPKLLVIDELSLGLAPIVVEHLLEVVRSFRDRGTTVVLVEQSVNVALTVADRAYFIEKGEVRFEGTATELLGRPDVLRSVILEGATAGSQAAAAAPSEAAGQAEPPARVSVGARRSPRTGAEVILEVSGLSKSFAGISAVNDVGLRLHDGEVLGLLGPNGAGKTTVFDLISGFLTPTAGSIVLGGTDLTGTSPHVRARMGLSRSFQDARMFPSLTVRQAIAVGLDRLTIGDPVAAALHVPDVADAEQRLAADVDDLIEVMELGDHRNKFVAELSTGTRRVVDLTCQIGIAPKVVLFDEPSSGIAQRDAEALGPVLLRIKEQLGASLVVIEHDMPLLRAVSDRVIALDLGRVIAEGTSEAVLAHPAVVASYLGGDAAAIRRSGPSEPVLDLRASALSPNGIAPSPAVEDH